MKEIENRRYIAAERRGVEFRMEYEEEHHKECSTPGCPECEDARIMLAHSRSELKRLPPVPPRRKPACH